MKFLKVVLCAIILSFLASSCAALKKEKCHCPSSSYNIKAKAKELRKAC